MEFDFGGYATKNNVRCADGRRIKPNAFIAQDGMKVPLVWQHQRNDPTNVIGHAILENREDGVYAYCKLNSSDKAKHTKLIVEHGDVCSLSIYANKLSQKGADVTHGVIREVSVVVAGANPGALIDNPIVQHSDDGEEYEDLTRAIILFPEEVEYFEHSDDDDDDSEEEEKEEKETKKSDKKDELAKSKKKSKSVKMEDKDDDDEDEDDDSDEEDDSDDSDDSAEHADTDDKEETVQDVYNAMTPKQKKVVAYMIGAALASAEEEEDDDEDTSAEHSEMEEDTDMKENVFDKGSKKEKEDITSLTHDQFTEIMNDAKKCGSLRESFLEHATTYGIENIDVLFPDATDVSNSPYMIKRDTEWVANVLANTTHLPFSRIKSTAADITADEARARGYVKGNLKKDEVIRLLKRTTNPTTVYKKQKLDRDDVIDITSLDVIAWLKGEMRVMLNEELARAYLIGDGRAADSDDKINEDCIRPIWTDDDMYAHHIKVAYGATPDQFVEEVIASRKYYKGSGTPTFYTTSDTLTAMLLVKDKIGRRLYNSEAELASAMRVKEIVEVPVMDGANREVKSEKLNLLGIIVNLRDYHVGATRGGQISMFDDFDIDYNQFKYLIETRCSGALVMPKSALVLEQVATEPSSSGSEQPTPESLG